MATLSDFKVKFIKISKWIGLFIGAILLVIFIIRGAMFIKEKVAPSPPPPPTVTFGKLPAIFFPNGIKKNFSYTLDTLTGDLPTLPDKSKVYKMDLGEPDILAVERASEKVTSLGFEGKVEQLSDTVYRWRSPDLFKILVLNVRLSEFSLSSGFATNAGVLTAKNLPNEKEAVDIAKNFLNALSAFPEDLDENKTKTELFLIKNGTVSDATSLSNAQVITVNFFQKDRDELPIAYPLGKSSLINVTVSGGETEPQVVDARFFYQKIQDDSATYPIKTASQALDELKKGNAYVASHKGKDTNILIKKIYLAYFAQGRQHEFLMPVVVFEGGNDFIAYVSAVTGEWISN